MARNISFFQYMRAHGNTPGPTQRPMLTGAIGGAVAEIPSGILLYWSEAFAGVAKAIGVGLPAVFAAHSVITIVAGILYAEIFKRAANDKHGGWLFGASFGFFLWMFSPITIWQVVTPYPVAVAGAAMGLFAGHVLYGLALGFIYPHIHALVQARMRRPAKPDAAPKEVKERAIVRHPEPRFVGESAKIRAGKH